MNLDIAIDALYKFEPKFNSQIEKNAAFNTSHVQSELLSIQDLKHVPPSGWEAFPVVKE